MSELNTDVQMELINSQKYKRLEIHVVTIRIYSLNKKE